MAKKTLILVRHGQYHRAEEGSLERLTALGRKQATYAGRRLREYKIDRLVHSTMPRAMETASIIHGFIRPRRKMESSADLCECVPGFPKALRAKYGYTDTRILKRHIAQADRAYKRFFTPSSGDRVEVLVCHGNIIRYLVCRLLGANTLLWRTMDIQQCGITIIEIETKGTNRRRLISHNDVGHIPMKERTFI